MTSVIVDRPVRVDRRRVSANGALLRTQIGRGCDVVAGSRDIGAKFRARLGGRR